MFRKLLTTGVLASLLLVWLVPASEAGMLSRLLCRLRRPVCCCKCQSNRADQSRQSLDELIEILEEPLDEPAAIPDDIAGILGVAEEG